MSDLDPRAVGKGAAVAAAVAVVAGLTGRALDAQSSLMFLLVIVIFGAMGVGGYLAGREHPEVALTTGGVAALVASVGVQLVNIGFALAKGTLTAGSMVTVLFIVLLSTSMGVIGGYLAFRRAATNGAEDGASKKEAV